ncbi:MAG: MgtC/SapB family protein [Sedimentisphaerales bacterium]|nr:MgtC/SapB family protein [Sedimentisphaerales bacterium]
MKGNIVEVLRILLAVVLGGVIGLERQLSGKPAGLRTNIMICLGSAVFTIISEHMAKPGDSVTRIASQIVTGVGFLGAGAIIRERGGIHGLTTAATIWLVASIGMACGAGFYSLAVISTIIAIIVLIGLVKLDKYLEQSRAKLSSQKNNSFDSAQDRLKS